MTGNSGRRLGIALIGCGEVVRAKHLPALARVVGAEVVALCDVDVSRRERVAAQFRIAGMCGTIDEVLARRDVDAIGVCTDPGSHPELAIAAMRSGRHVLVEKPLALSVPECQCMIEEAGRAGVVAMAGFHMRFHRLVREVREQIRRGAAGDIKSIRLVWHSPRGDAEIPAWKTRRCQGGGALVEIAVHHLDLVRFLTGADIERILAFTRNGVREDEDAVISARTTSGVLVSGEFSERSPHEIEIVVSGPKGSVRADCLRFDGLEVRSVNEIPGTPAVRLRSLLRTLRALPAGLGILRRGGDYRISYHREWAHFVEAVRTGTVPEATFADGLHASEAVAAATESAATGSATKVGGAERAKLDVRG
jgi:myo-inositol 2-dehydrogenase/D-chiro-inositol 1-dehydrogenase